MHDDRQQDDEPPDMSMANKPSSGAGMDRRIVPTRKRHWRQVGIAVGILALLWLGWAMLPGGVSVAAEDIQTASVTDGVFHDDVAVRARAEPLNSIVLDSMEEGRVEEVVATDGSIVSKGELLFRLSNPMRNLALLERQAEIAQQISNRSTLRETQESLRSAYVRRIADLEYELDRDGKRLARFEELASQKYVSESELETARDSHAQLARQIRLEGERHRAENEVSRQALTQLDEAIGRMQAGLTLVNNTLDGLAVRSPTDGRLTGMKLQVGQTVTMGQHIGRIDDPNLFKLSTLVDEYYLSRISMDQSGVVRMEGREYPVKVSAIFPQVKDGRFSVELVFASEQPKSLRPGQGVDLRITMGQPKKARTLPNGAYMNDTGGTWVFVVDGGHARRRDIRIGQRSNNQVEVLAGLEPGERVITSSYVPFGDAKTLAITE
ncbi:Putative efflux system component YknX [Xanthomonas arboricola pv. corylina]|uniref:Efflux system component YknX n=2 Tax=Xanthomonas arboricola TaxID=56448 RepID=A0A8D6V5S2_9XANT|nr:Putative efflux system component YknX [Xanthomonas arboricola pv. corylina]CAE6772388.1 Putative efflux system component YknX [Xanthomonas arboricola pv. corylina]